jgi:hypothetical protein
LGVACQQDIDRRESLLAGGIGALLSHRRRTKTSTTKRLYDVEEGVRRRALVERNVPEMSEDSESFRLRATTHPHQRLAQQVTLVFELNVATLQCRPAAFSFLCFV